MRKIEQRIGYITKNEIDKYLKIYYLQKEENWDDIGMDAFQGIEIPYKFCE